MSFSVEKLINEKICTEAPKKLCRHNCIINNTSNSGYACDCNNGYTLDADGKICFDIDECLDQNRCPSKSKCINFRGTYYCSCDKGLLWDGDDCVLPINYNSLNPEPVKSCNNTICGANGICHNTTDGPKCDCNTNYELTHDGTNCIDIDECNRSLANCSPLTQTCINTLGGYQCACIPGFTNNNNSDYECGDVDECETGTAKCQKNSKCLNTEGSYLCLCNSGYVWNGTSCEEFSLYNMTTFNNQTDNETYTCEDIDCGDNAQCFDSDKGPKCLCNDNYQLSQDGINCIDFDECTKSQTNNCSEETETCVNIMGSYYCECKTGFQRNVSNNKCTDINECELKTINCTQHSSCNNSIGSYSCVCNEGFAWNGNSCEQQHMPNYENQSNYEQTGLRGTTQCQNIGCGNNSYCVNIGNEAKCLCENNYEMSEDGINCVNIDECNNTQKNNCSSLVENCINTSEGYYCECKIGFHRNAIGVCSDIDECQLKTSRCAENAICENIEGSYKCQCKENFEGDGFTCIEKMPPLPRENFCANNKVCGENATCISMKSRANCQCKRGYFGDPYKACVFRDPAKQWLMKTTLRFPMKFHQYLAYNYSDVYFNFSMDVKDALKIMMGIIQPGLSARGIWLENLR